MMPVATTPLPAVQQRAPRRASMAAPIACAGCLAGAAAYIALDDPADGGAFLPCPFHVLTGWWCPGCGLTRATHALLRGRVRAALGYNLFLPIVLAAIALSWLSWVRVTSGRLPIGHGRTATPIVLTVTVVAFVAFGVVRNLPGLAALAP